MHDDVQRAPGLLTLALFAYLGCASEATATSCLDFSATPFRIKIYNNSPNYNIFPVVTTPTNGPDEWLQGGFQVPTADIATRTYGHDYTYRFYIKPEVGIAQGGSVTLSLPLCTQLVGTPGDGSAKDEWIDWWNGGRILIYANPATNSKQPPAALSTDLAADNLVQRRDSTNTTGPEHSRQRYKHRYTRPASAITRFALIVIAESGGGPAGSLPGGNPARRHPKPRPRASTGTQPQENDERRDPAFGESH